MRVGTLKKKGLQAIAESAAKKINTEGDRNAFRQMLVGMTAETALNAELEAHFCSGKGEGSDAGNNRNGYTSKALRTEEGEFELDIPRGRSGHFESELVKKY